MFNSIRSGVASLSNIARSSPRVSGFTGQVAPSLRSITPVDDISTLTYKQRGVSSYGNEIPYGGAVPTSSSLSPYRASRNTYNNTTDDVIDVASEYAPHRQKATLQDKSAGYNWRNGLMNLAFNAGTGFMVGGPAGAASGIAVGIGQEVIGASISKGLQRVGVAADLAGQAGFVASIPLTMAAQGALTPQQQSEIQMLTPGQIAQRQYNMMQGR